MQHASACFHGSEFHMVKEGEATLGGLSTFADLNLSRAPNDRVIIA